MAGDEALRTPEEQSELNVQMSPDDVETAELELHENIVLQEKILQKIPESARKHKEKLEKIRKKMEELKKFKLGVESDEELEKFKFGDCQVMRMKQMFYDVWPSIPRELLEAALKHYRRQLHETELKHYKRLHDTALKHYRRHCVTLPECFRMFYGTKVGQQYIICPALNRRLRRETVLECDRRQLCETELECCMMFYYTEVGQQTDPPIHTYLVSRGYLRLDSKHGTRSQLNIQTSGNLKNTTRNIFCQDNNKSNDNKEVDKPFSPGKHMKTAHCVLSFLIATIAFLWILTDVCSLLSIIKLQPEPGPLFIWFSLLEPVGFMVFVCAVATMIVIGAPFSRLLSAILLFWGIWLLIRS